MTNWKLALGAAAVIAGGAAVYVATHRGMESQAAAPAAPAMQAMPVPVANVEAKTIPIYLDYAARIESIRNVALQAKIAGYVQEQPVDDGTDVASGTLLYRIDPRDYRAALNQAKAQLQHDVAALEYAAALSQRGNESGKSGALSRDVIEQRNSAVTQGQATVAADEAAVQQAENNLGYTEIRAPFAGRVGRNRAPVGTLINGAGTPLNTIVQLDPIYVTFNASETELAQIQRARGVGPLSVEITVPGETDTGRRGELTFIDNAVDTSTGTITARATIKNKDFRLLPGQYVHARVLIRQQPDTLMVPQVAVGSSQLGKFLYVVGEGSKVELRQVTLGPADGDQVAVLNGIRSGDMVITGNLQKIGPGVPVQPLPPGGDRQAADAMPGRAPR
jgi:multidrug efflux system membrane fusion protein